MNSSNDESMAKANMLLSYSIINVIVGKNKAEHAVQSYAAGIGGQETRGPIFNA